MKSMKPANHSVYLVTHLRMVRSTDHWDSEVRAWSVTAHAWLSVRVPGC